MKTYACPYTECLRNLSTAYNLKKHIEAHHLHLKPFKCGRCQQTFAYKHSLKHHYLSHLPVDWTQIENSVISVEITIPKLTDLVKVDRKAEAGGKTKFPVMPFLQLPDIEELKAESLVVLPNIFNC